MRDDQWRSVLVADDISVIDENVDYSVNKTFNELDARIKKLEDSDDLPYGIIIMWANTIIPAGWSICDGRTIKGRKTPDLRDRFVIPASSLNTTGYNVGSIPKKYSNFNINDFGGEATHRLTINEMPKHKHVVPWGDHWYQGGPWGYYGRQNNYGAHGNVDGYNVWRYTSPEGNDKPHNNLPPFCSLVYIMLTG